MAETTKSEQRSTLDVVFTASATSDPVRIADKDIIGIRLPAGEITAATLTFQGGRHENDTFLDVRRPSDAALVTVTVNGNQDWYPIEPSDLYGVGPYVRVVSNASSTGTIQLIVRAIG